MTHAGERHPESGGVEGIAPDDPLTKYATAPEWLDDARQAMQALYGAAAGHPNADVIERNVARINEALKRVRGSGVAARIDALQEAAAKVVEGFERGIFVRDVHGDNLPGWTLKILPYINALSELSKAARAVSAGGEEKPRG